MVTLAAGMLLIIFLTGSPVAPAPSRPSVLATQPNDSDRVRDYQERLRALDAQATLDAKASASTEKALAPSFDNDSPAAAPADPVAVDRRRRDYDSLFASNVVLSRRQERPDAGTNSAVAEPTASRRPDPSIDDIADAVVRATAKGNGPSSVVSLASVKAPPAATVGSAQAQPSPTRTDPISAAGPLHRLLEGTLIEAVLTNRLDGDAAAPVNCLVTTPVYSHSGLEVVIPAGARVLGETKPIQSVGETRLAVVFHRLVMPDGSTATLDQFRGLNQIGDSGLRDRVNQHYWSTFGAAAAVGLVSGLSQLVSTAGLGDGQRDRTVIVTGSGADAASQATSQVMNRFLNRLPTITIREGHRVSVYLTNDLDLPAWRPIAGTTLSEAR